MTWDQILFSIAPILTATGKENKICSKLNNLADELTNWDEFDLDGSISIAQIKIYTGHLNQIRMQFEGLGFIEHHGDDLQTCWYLTELEKQKIVELTTLKKGEVTIRKVSQFQPIKTSDTDE